MNWQHCTPERSSGTRFSTYLEDGRDDPGSCSEEMPSVTTGKAYLGMWEAAVRIVSIVKKAQRDEHRCSVCLLRYIKRRTPAHVTSPPTQRVGLKRGVEETFSES